MPGWITDVQGYREILDAAGDPVQRRKTFQVIGATVTDDGEVTVIEVPPGATGIAGPTGATGSGLNITNQAFLQDDFLAITSGLTADGILFSTVAWGFDLIAGTATLSQRTTIEKNHPGQLSLATGPTTGEWALTLGDSAVFTKFEAFKRIRFVWRTSVTFATTVASLGMGTAQGLNAAASSLFFYADPATSANWRARTRDGSAQTANVDTGVAITAGAWTVLDIERDPDTDMLTYRINGTPVATIPAATHLIDAADEYKVSVHFDNNNAGVSTPVLDLVMYESIDTLDRTI
jgi:hypothetical protein